VRFTQITKVFEGAHTERRAGSQEEANRYCEYEPGLQEDGSQVIGPVLYFGKMMVATQGKRNDLIDIRDKLHKNVPIQEIAFDHFGSWVRYNKSFDKYAHMLSQPRDFKTRVVILYGESGVGKTRIASKYAEHNSW